MGNIYKYEITDMQRDSANIVKTVNFNIVVSDGTDSFNQNFFTGLPAPKDTPVPYENLTQEAVIAWVKDLVGIDSEQSADAEFEAYKIRKNEIQQNGLPWQ
jgi:hypothetical protein